MGSTIEWPEDKRFAFTVFDDPDSQPLEDSRVIYSFLADLGFRTTKGVWVQGPFRQGNSRSETCDNPAYLQHVLDLQRQGFEIGFHNASLHSSEREETRAALERFRQFFGEYPSAMSNHFSNAEAIYWGEARLGGAARLLYQLASKDRGADHYSGHMENSPYFWGDLCRDHIRFCRNFVFRDVNTLRICPEMPYYDPERPYVRQWYASSEGADARLFQQTISEENQDRLEKEQGACIIYTHFGKGFVEEGRAAARFRELMERLSRKDGWFVSVSTLLQYLQAKRGERVLSPRERRRLERLWIWEKIRHGTS
jgi:hypothetical protein